MYSEGNHVLEVWSHCSSAMVVPLIWWYKKVVDRSDAVALASLVKGNEEFGGTSGRPATTLLPPITGCVPLIHMKIWAWNVAISDRRIEFLSMLVSRSDTSIVDAVNVNLRTTIREMRIGDSYFGWNFHNQCDQFGIHQRQSRRNKANKRQFR